jgi:alpha-glucoside transport system substrate-binding protein
MTTRFGHTRQRWAALVVILAFLLAACGGNDDKKSSSGGTSTGGGNATVKISGPETGAEADGFTESFKGSGITPNYTGSRDFETQLRVAAEGGDLPDIALIPQPGLARDLADKITPVPDATLKAHKDEYYAGLVDLVTVSGKVLGLPVKADLKSLVWYSPKTFKAKGYTVPTTFAELTALQDKMKKDGIAPWCIGIESGDATGWPLTDWFEDLMLRMYGPDVYDQWVAHKIPFNDPKVAAVGQQIEKIWFTQGNVLNGRASIASTGFAQAGLPVADGKCGLHRQANFFGANFKTANPNVVFGPQGDIDVFYLPTIDDKFGKVTLVGGIFAVAFNDKPATVKTMEFLASPAYSNARIKTKKSGFLSPNTKAVYDDPLDKLLVDIFAKADPTRFDGSDQMPGAVGSGAFWKEGTNWVLGSQSLKAFLDNVEKAWPKS